MVEIITERRERRWVKHDGLDGADGLRREERVELWYAKY
jgi:hypothetical protein